MAATEFQDASSSSSLAASLYLFALAFLLTLVGIYPSSPVLLLLMGSNPAISFTAACFAAILMIRGIAKPSQPLSNNQYSKYFKLLVAAVVGIISLKIAINYASLAARELLIGLVAWHFIKLTTEQMRTLLRFAIYIVAAVMLVSFLATLVSYYLGYGSYSAWNISYLHYLPADNPLVNRRGDGAYVAFYMPYYLAIIPAYVAQESVAFGLPAFQRQNFIFTEWSYLSFFLVPLMFYCWGDKTMRARLAIICLFAVTFILTFSAWGVVVISAVLMAMLVNRIVRSPKVIVWTALACGAFTLVVLGPTGLLALVGGNKLEQFYLFFGDKLDLSKLLTPFGVGTESYLNGADGFIYYGVLNIVFVYGIAGLVGYTLLAVYIGLLGLSVLRRSSDSLSTLLNYSTIAALLVFILGIKLTYLLPLFLFMFAGFVSKLLDQRSGVNNNFCGDAGRG